MAFVSNRYLNLAKIAPGEPGFSLDHGALVELGDGRRAKIMPALRTGMRYAITETAPPSRICLWDDGSCVDGYSSLNVAFLLASTLALKEDRND